MIIAQATTTTRYPELYGSGTRIGYKAFNSIKEFKNWAYYTFDIVKYKNSKQPIYLADHDCSHVVQLRKVNTNENISDLSHDDLETLYISA